LTSTQKAKPQIKQWTAARYCASTATFRTFLPNANEYKISVQLISNFRTLLKLQKFQDSWDPWQKLTQLHITPVQALLVMLQSVANWYVTIRYRYWSWFSAI